MKVILYIGHHKVGSTALQAYLAQNWLQLAQAGILYPSVEGLGFASNLATILRPEAPSQIKQGQVLVREPHSALAYRMIQDAISRPVPPQFNGHPATSQMLRTIQKQVEVLAPHTVILCSEAFANFGQVDAKLITQLCAPFQGADLHVYCALRRPDHYLASWHGQRLKVGEPAAPLEPGGLAQYANTIHFNYRNVLEPWIEQLPDATFSIRNYAEVVENGGSGEDFVLQTGLTLPEGMQAPGRANSSLPKASFPIMEQAVAHLPRPKVQALSQYFQAEGKALCRKADARNGDVELFGEAQRKEMHRRFLKESETYLSQLTGQPAFFEGLDEVLIPRPLPAREAAHRLLQALPEATLAKRKLRDAVATVKAHL
uniref:hypothetical protein n=1 Tax=Ruegeria sp. PR1b TaxID=185588 RepID=UPI00146AAA5B|nr:hypothetical protein [Ruegeria sp. PR1b]